MKAINPKTGKPISIMRTETHITKTNRTLLWYREGLVGDVSKWQRWSTLVTESDPLDFKPDIIFLYEEPTEELKEKWSTWLKTATNESFIIATPKWLEALKLNLAVEASILATNEIYQRYPFLPNLSNDAPKTTWLLCIAQLMRFHVFVSPLQITDTEPAIFRGSIKIIESTANASNIVPEIWLIQQYFVAQKPQRAREINKVLDKNISCKSIDKIVLLNEKIYNDLPKSDKLIQENIGKRLTYLDVLYYIKNSIPKDTIVIFSNSDIYMDNTLNQIYSIDLQKKFLALLRYDVSDLTEEATLFGPRADSQDTWIVWSSSIDFELTEEDFGFNFGIPGCDNALTLAFLKKKFIVSNPAYSIKTYHIHNSNIRTYITSDVIDKPIFLYIEPTGIQEYNPEKDLKKHKLKSWTKSEVRSFQRPIRYVDKTTAETICNMMMRSTNPYSYSVDSSNTFNKAYDENSNELYLFSKSTKNDIFTMPAGIVCDYDNLYVGNHPTWKDEWTKAPLTILTNTVHVPSMVAVHFPQEIAHSASQWFLNYLPSVLQIYKNTDEAPEFVVSIHPDTQRALSLLKWPTNKEITMIPYLQDCQYLSEKVYLLSPRSFPEVPPENIDILRSLLPKVEPNTNPSVVIVVERTPDAIMSSDFVNQLVKNIFHRKDRGMWQVTIVDVDVPTESRLTSLMKADLVIAPSESTWDALDWCWLMQSKKTVVEIMPDTKPRGDHIHLAGASNLNYILLGVKREPISFQRQHIIEDMEKVMKQHLFSENLKAQVPRTHLPIITIPSGKALSGIHDHANDTFREMTQIWEERGYCLIERHEDTPFVWWQGIGNVLLYDRPTLRWFNNPSYKLALFGNSIPENPTKNDRLWSFWARSPKAVERIVMTNKPMASYEERKIPSIFLGRIENGIQKEKRTKHDWSKVIHNFHMPIDSTGGAYKYNQDTYLSLLCQSRFGLCLPGYGPKCNREIEYLATGTVPIVTPGVDVVNYAGSLKENIHYFKAETPEDVKNIVETTSLEKWTEMSIAGRAWWRRYASAEGLFRLTWGIINEAQHEHGPNCEHN
jgi:hypothetical protein